MIVRICGRRMNLQSTEESGSGFLCVMRSNFVQYLLAKFHVKASQENENTR